MCWDSFHQECLTLKKIFEKISDTNESDDIMCVPFFGCDKFHSALSPFSRTLNMLSVTDINVSLTPNIKGKESDIEIRFTPRNEDIKRSHRFQLILTDCYTGFDIPKLGLRSSPNKVEGSFVKSECKVEFRFLNDVKRDTPVRVVIERSNRILLPETKNIFLFI